MAIVSTSLALSDQGESTSAHAAPEDLPTSTSTIELPDWYDENRVHAHTRLAMNFNQWLDEPEWTQAAEGFKDLGAQVFTRHFKTQAEDPWWPSDAPRGSDGERLFDDDRFNLDTFIPAGRDVAAEMVQHAQDEDMAQMAYYWHMTDQTAQDLNPDWVCRDPDGNPVPHRARGDFMDITGPFREVVLQRLLELAERGVDGLFFDERHLPGAPYVDHVCLGSALQEKWETSTGLPAPTQRNYNDPVFNEWMDFWAKEVKEVFEYWQGEVKSEYPDVVFIVSTTDVVGLLRRDMTTDLARLADVSKNEYHSAVLPQFNLNFFQNNSDIVEPDHDIRMALGWTVLRDAANGRPPHIWAPSRAPNTDHILAFASSLVTYGAVANVDVIEANILEANDPEGNTPRAALEAAFELGNQVSPYFVGTKPLRWAAVHYSEAQRNARLPNQRDAWREVLWPVNGAFGGLLREGVQAGIVTDAQLENDELDGYELLILSSRDELTNAQETAVADFEAAGGVVLENDPEWLWHDPDETDAAAAAFYAMVEPHLANAPVRVTGGPEGMHAVAHSADQDGDELIVAVTNDFSFVQTSGVEPEDVNPAPPPIQGAQVSWQSDHGQPPAVFEAVSEQWLIAEETDDGYTVTLPEFQHMALLVIGEEIDVISGTNSGPVTVASGEVTLLDGARQVGPVNVKDGGTLLVNGGAITGSLKAADAGQVAICGAEISGPISITGATGPVALGGDGCSSNSVAGSVTIADGTGGTVIAGNEIVGTLNCSGNDPEPVNHGQPNQVLGSASEQCSGL